MTLHDELLKCDLFIKGSLGESVYMELSGSALGGHTHRFALSFVYGGQLDDNGQPVQIINKVEAMRLS